MSSFCLFVAFPEILSIDTHTHTRAHTHNSRNVIQNTVADSKIVPSMCRRRLAHRATTPTSAHQSRLVKVNLYVYMYSSSFYSVVLLWFRCRSCNAKKKAHSHALAHAYIGLGMCRGQRDSCTCEVDDDCNDRCC